VSLPGRSAPGIRAQLAPEEARRSLLFVVAGPGRAALAALTALAGLFLAGCPQATPPPPPALPPAGLVDGAPISIAAVQREVDRLRGLALREPASGTAGRPQAAAAARPEAQTEAPDDAQRARDTAALARALLGPLVDQKLLAARGRQLGLAVSEAEVQRATDALAEEASRAGGPLPERLLRDGLTAEELHDETRERLLAERAMAHDVRELGLEKPTAQELKEYEAAHKAEREVPEQVHALHLFTSTPEKAKGLLDQLRRGAGFEVLARESGESPDARQGGDLGFISRGLLPPPVDETLWALRPGQLSGVIRSAYGYHLVRQVAKRPGHRRGDAEQREGSERKLLAEKRAVAERTLLEGLRDKAKISIDEAALAKVR
jgi:parvulin-like peptidyl-prolyl isomerase